MFLGLARKAGPGTPGGVGYSAEGGAVDGGTGGATSRTLTPTFETQSVSQIQIKIAGDCTWFPLHPPLRNAEESSSEASERVSGFPSVRGGEGTVD